MADHARDLRDRLAEVEAEGRTEAFAELMSQHDCALDPAWVGGNVREVTGVMGLLPRDGNAMLQRIRQRLGPQAV